MTATRYVQPTLTNQPRWAPKHILYATHAKIHSISINKHLFNNVERKQLQILSADKRMQLTAAANRRVESAARWAYPAAHDRSSRRSINVSMETGHHRGDVI